MCAYTTVDLLKFELPQIQTWGGGGYHGMALPGTAQHHPLTPIHTQCAHRATTGYNVRHTGYTCTYCTHCSNVTALSSSSSVAGNMNIVQRSVYRWQLKYRFVSLNVNSYCVAVMLHAIYKYKEGTKTNVLTSMYIWTRPALLSQKQRCWEAPSHSIQLSEEDASSVGVFVTTIHNSIRF